jgi:hypothetical protein
MELKDILSITGSVLAFAGLGFGLYQYYKAQKWKRAEFAAQQLEQLSKDADLELCCRLLDWGVRQSPVPQQYAALSKEKTFVHNWRVVFEAMLPEEDAKNIKWDWQHMMYRDIFDKLFAYLERTNHYIAINLISTRDVASLKYWLQQIRAPRFLPPEQQDVFLGFISRYGYSGVQQMMSRFGLGYEVPAQLPAGSG